MKARTKLGGFKCDSRICIQNEGEYKNFVKIESKVPIEALFHHNNMSNSPSESCCKLSSLLLPLSFILHTPIHPAPMHQQLDRLFV